MSNRALYSPDTDRALYSPDTGRALFKATKVFPYYHGKRNYQAYEVTTGTTGTRDDVYPSVLDNLTFTWDIAGSSAYSEWATSSTKATLYWSVYTQIFTTTAYEGKTLVAIPIKANPLYWDKPAGSGDIMVSVQASESDTPGTSLSWVYGTKQLNIATSSFKQMWHVDITLGKYLFITRYINALQPPTASGDQAENGIYSASGFYIA